MLLLLLLLLLLMLLLLVVIHRISKTSWLVKVVSTTSKHAEQVLGSWLLLWNTAITLWKISKIISAKHIMNWLLLLLLLLRFLEGRFSWTKVHSLKCWANLRCLLLLLFLRSLSYMRVIVVILFLQFLSSILDFSVS